MKRVLCLVLALLLPLLPGCSALPATASAYLDVRNPDDGRRAFADIPPPETDGSALIQALTALESAMADAPEKELYAAYRAAEKQYAALDSAAAQAYLRYCMDVTDDARRHAYDALSATLDEAETRLADIAVDLSARPGLSRRFTGAEKTAFSRSDALNAPEIRMLLLRERSLEAEFEQLRQTLTVEYAGRAWTIEQIESDQTLPLRAFFELLDVYDGTVNRRANAVYGALVETRNEIAAQMAFPSYPAYRYAVYGRAYTPEDAAAFCQRVKAALVPLYLDAVERFSDDAAYFYSAAFSQEEAFRCFGSAIASAFPQLLPAWDGMLELGLYDTQVSACKMAGSFTTYLSQYRAPFLFTQWDESGQSVSTLAHEFGHFSSYWRNPPRGVFSTLDLDLAEADAQSLELLLWDQYETLYGRYADAARIHALLSALYAVLSGCMEDEFQQWAYAHPDAAAEERNRAYLDIAAGYGFTAAFGVTGTEWVWIDHTFLSPMYYISYAVSTVTALSLWQQMQTAPAAAKRAYLRLQMRQEGESMAAVLRGIGADDPMSDAAVTGIRDALAAFFTSQRAG